MSYYCHIQVCNKVKKHYVLVLVFELWGTQTNLLIIHFIVTYLRCNMLQQYGTLLPIIDC